MITFLKMKSVKVLRSEKGMSLLQVMVFVAMASILILAVQTMSRNVTKQAVQMSELAEIDIFRRNMVQLIDDTPTWNVILSRNASMSCLSGGRGASCPVWNRTSFDLYLADGTLYYNSTNGSSGIDLNGVRCMSYPSKACPLRFNVQWSAMDNTGYPNIAIIVTLTVGTVSGQPATDLKFNPANYSYDITPGTSWPPSPGAYPKNLIYRKAE